MTNLRILHVEDDPQAAKMVADTLSRVGDHVANAANGKDGLRLASEEPFDLVILDRMLPDMTGIDIVSKLRAVGISIPVLMLSALGRTENRIEGLDAGVDDYLAKPFEQEELIARVRALHRRATGRSHSAVIIFGDMECHIKARTAHRQGRHIALSPKEFELFRYFMQNSGEVVTREMLLRDVWNLNFDPQTNVIDVNVGRLRRKLEEGFDSPVLETIWGAGYRLLAA
ncbi:response regulator transcription factor [Parasphingorhabdus halotolerans]|uniref:Response regulator transcription factor n=1 Tax=Parasphingorhabdus halotolerans TaxID=2725558 RepID=A0A6H2DS29_9SPHN|nr:response regulator transcription factor [Parasphingorhabdus halotolerans]QJB70466.1 response regulator transcription factor [Parasphingorhabdus halotolerans]